MKRTQASGIIALGVHGAILLAVGLRRPSGPGESLPATVTEIELESPAGSPGSEAEQSPAPAKPDPWSRAEAHASAMPRRSASEEGAREAPVASAPSAPPAEPPADDGSWTFSPGSTPDGGLLSGGRLADAVSAGVRATLAEERAEERLHSNPLKKLLPSITEHDIELGLFPGGALVTLARDAVRRSRAPNVGRALLEFQLDGAGVVASVRVLEASSDRTDWEEAAGDLAREARAAPPQRIPSGSKGVALTVEVTSAIKTVSGATNSRDPLKKIVGAIVDPVDTVIDGQNPAQRVVAARVVGVEAL